MLITGACGFIGFHVLENLFHKYPQVHFVNVDKMTYAANAKNLPAEIQGDARYTFYKADICDGSAMHEIFEVHYIDTVLHFAAESHVEASFQSSLEFTQTNVVGTHTLLQTALKFFGPGKPLKKFIHVSTDEVYGEANYDFSSSSGGSSAKADLKCGFDEATSENQIAESHVLNPTNPYAASKAAAEALVNAYCHSFKLPTVITRSNNVYGPRQFPEKVIPKFILRLLRGERMPLHGNGSSFL